MKKINKPYYLATRSLVLGLMAISPVYANDDVIPSPPLSIDQASSTQITPVSMRPPTLPPKAGSATTPKLGEVVKGQIDTTVMIPKKNINAMIDNRTGTTPARPMGMTKGKVNIDVGQGIGEAISDPTQAD